MTGFAPREKLSTVAGYAPLGGMKVREEVRP